MASDPSLHTSAADDGELLRRYVSARCEDAFSTLVRRHLPLVYHVALRKVGHDPHLAEDVAQRVFADVAAKATSLQRHPALTGWLFTGAHYAAAQLVRAERRRKEREQKAHAMSELAQESTPVVDWEQFRPLLDELVLALPQRDREALLLRYFEGRSFAEVGTRLQLTDHGARARVERALDKLRTKLSRRGITSTSAALGLGLTSQTPAAVPAGLAVTVTGAALSASTTSTALAVGAIGFMSTKFITVGAALVALSAIGFGILQRMRAQAAVAEASTLREERATLAAQLARAEQRAQQVESRPPIPTEITRHASRSPARPPAASDTPDVELAQPSSPPPTLEATKEALASVSNAGGKAFQTLNREHHTRVRTWVDQDPTGLVRWIATVPAGRQREHTTEAVIAITTETHPDFAFLLTSGIARDLPRMNRRSEVLRAWAPRDPDAAVRAVSAADVTEQERGRLLSIIAATRKR